MTEKEALRYIADHTFTKMTIHDYDLFSLAEEDSRIHYGQWVVVLSGNNAEFYATDPDQFPYQFMLVQ